MAGLRIVHISQECSGNGGVGRYLLGLYSALQENGHEVYAIHSDSSVSRSPDGVVQDFRVDALSTNSASGSSSDVLKILGKIRPDLVHIHNNSNFALEYEIRNHYPAIKSLHTYEFCPSQTKYHHLPGKTCSHSTSLLCLPRMGYKRCMLSKRPWVLWQYYRNCKAANRNNLFYQKLIVASQYVKRQAKLTGYPSEQIEVLPYFTEAPPEHSLYKPAEKQVLFVGRVVPEKGVLHLLQAFSRVSTPATLVIVGSGMQLKQARELSTKLGVGNAVKFTGWVDHQKMQSIYQDATVVVVPSLWPEPFGIVGIEAMSYAKPVVAFSVGGIPEWLEDSVTGFAVSPYDVQEMSEKIAYLLNNQELAQRMGIRGRNKALTEFSPAKHVHKLIQIYRKVSNNELQTTTG